MNLFPVIPLQTAQPQGGSGMSFYVMLAALGLIWFFLVIRPQQQRQKKQESSLGAAEKGDHVITTGGLHGKITTVGDKDFTIEIASLKGGVSVRVKIEKNRIESVTKPGDVKKEGEGS